MRRAFAVTLWLAVLAGSVTQAQDPASVDARVDRDSITVGDRVTLTLTVHYGLGERPIWPEAPEAFQPFELIERRAVLVQDTLGRVRASAEYVLTAFELGSLEVPALDVGIRTPQGTDRFVRTPPVTLTVASVQPDSVDIVDIKAPLALARNWWLLLPWVAVTGALLVAGLWAYRRYGRREVSDAQAASLPPRPPELVAYEALDRLQSSDLLERGDLKQFFSDLSGIIRVYLDGRFRVDAMEMTSHDVLRELASRRVGGAALDRFRQFFETCDLVKFAKSRPALVACRAMVSLARGLVEETTPKQIEPDAADPGLAADADARVPVATQ